jgi:hypothetical protein
MGRGAVQTRGSAAAGSRVGELVFNSAAFSVPASLLAL